MKKLNVLVTGCGGDIGQSICKILKKTNFIGQIIGIDIHDKTPAIFIYPHFEIGLPCSDDNYLEIFVDEKGFYLNYGYRKRSRYSDDEIFNELLPLVKKRNKEINSENFNEIWEEVMIESGIMRDNNLNELGI